MKDLGMSSKMDLLESSNLGDEGQNCTEECEPRSYRSDEVYLKKHPADVPGVSARNTPSLSSFASLFTFLRVLAA
jgi:hypothetical protein